MGTFYNIMIGYFFGRRTECGEDAVQKLGEYERTGGAPYLALFARCGKDVCSAKAPKERTLQDKTNPSN